MKNRYNAEYSGERLAHVAFPMGGLGSGMMCLEGTGMLSHVSLRHRPDVLNEPNMFSAISVEGHPEYARVLESQIPDYKILKLPNAGLGLSGKNYGLARFHNGSFVAKFPFGTVKLEDDRVPIKAEITGWSPFIPNDVDNSSLPVAALKIKLMNTGAEKLKCVYSFHAFNFMEVYGYKGEVKPCNNGFILSQPPSEDKKWIKGDFCAEVDDDNVLVDCGWFRGGWFDTLTMLWNGIYNCKYHQRPPHKGEQSKGASLYVPFELEPGASKEINLRFSWFVPYTDLREGRAMDGSTDAYEPWYASKFDSIEDVSDYWKKNYQSLLERTTKFTDSFFSMTLPDELIEAVSANLSILKSPTILRQKDGRLWGYEGCCDGAGSCHGTCTHVWNYAQSICHLFPEMERTLRETEFFVSQNEEGHQQFRSNLPISEPPHDFHAAADGQLGCIIKVYRDWRISGDNAWLEKIWPKVKKSLEFCINLWDPKHQGVLTEPHHNTYDIEFWGPDGMCNSIYLSALIAAAKMADYLGDKSASEFYLELYNKGRIFVEENLFNGEYFYQKVQWEGLNSKLHLDDCNPETKVLLESEGPKYQYGNGCLSDGIIGVWFAAVAGLEEEILDSNMVNKHLESVYKYNLLKNLRGHSNPQRPGYAINEEGGLLLCSWPHGGKPSLPFVYSDEVWTGIEYQVASHLIFTGHVEEGLDIVRTCRDRYDGRVRNPFNEYECGYWYARAMASYSLIQAITGIRYDAVSKVLHVKPRISGDFTSFISTATGYGNVYVKGGEVSVEVIEGEIKIESVDYIPAN